MNSTKTFIHYKREEKESLQQPPKIIMHTFLNSSPLAHISYLLNVQILINVFALINWMPSFWTKFVLQNHLPGDCLWWSVNNVISSTPCV